MCTCYPIRLPLYFLQIQCSWVADNKLPPTTPFLLLDTINTHCQYCNHSDLVWQHGRKRTNKLLQHRYSYNRRGERVKAKFYQLKVDQSSVSTAVWSDQLRTSDLSHFRQCGVCTYLLLIGVRVEWMGVRGVRWRRWIEREYVHLKSLGLGFSWTRLPNVAWEHSKVRSYNIR